MSYYKPDSTYHQYQYRRKRIVASATAVVSGDDLRFYDKSLMVRYFNLRTGGIMALLTVFLLFLPLVLPPLPPPPSMVLFVPILIMMLLVILAVSPAKIPGPDVIPETEYV
ncbi:OLC1v1036497C2 [Oldenlandia corymbosa var. corymbosa]|nr:OLC1v1036497C2 [Oldenlandia corymbosa var. corymbosa]